MNRIDDTLRGTVGFFWKFGKPVDLKGEPLRGYVQLHDDQWLVVDCLDEDPMCNFFSAQEEVRNDWPPSLAGMTGEAGVLLLNQRFSSSQVRGGASRASTFHYRFRTILAGVDLDDLRSPKVRGIRAEFDDGLAWAGMQAITSNHEYLPDGSMRLGKVTIVLDGRGQENQSRVAAGVQLTLKPTWSIAGPDTSQSISSALLVRCTSKKPVSFDTLAKYIDDVRSLLWICHGRMVSCDSVATLPHYRSQSEGEWAETWDDRLLEKGGDILPPRASKQSRWALVGLSDLGGTATALSRWIRFHETHGRFTGPVVHGFRLGGQVPVQTHAMSVAAAIEYYYAFNRFKKKAWAVSDSHKNRALAKYAGRAFAKWIGDIEKWSNELLAVYNSIKHNPSATVDPYKTLLLTQAGEVLISCVTLDEIAQNRRPSTRFLSDHRTEDLGRRLRKELGI